MLQRCIPVVTTLAVLSVLASVRGDGNTALGGSTQRCISGTMWRRNCNDCYCEKQIPFCHDLVCNLPPGVERTRCESGTTWKKDCNLCVCNNGIPVCSNLICPSTSNGVIRKERCTEGKVWKNGCNQCFCFFGLVACTFRPCNQTVHGSESRTKPSLWKPTLMFEIGASQSDQCTFGTSWRDKCNYCFCSYGIVACTMRECSTRGADEVVSSTESGTAELTGTSSESNQFSSSTDLQTVRDPFAVTESAYPPKSIPENENWESATTSSSSSELKESSSIPTTEASLCVNFNPSLNQEQRTSTRNQD